METPIVGRYDVIVAGGGPSGLIASLAAARSGARTLLIERYGFLGGNATAGLMVSLNGFRNQKRPEALQTVKGIPAEFIGEVVGLGGVADTSVPYGLEVEHDAMTGDLPYCVGIDAEAAKVAALKMIKKEGVNLRLHSWVVGPMMESGRVSGVIVESKSGRQGIAADMVIDATGDGDVAAGGGAESIQSPADKRDLLAMSLMYRIGGIPKDVERYGIRIADRNVEWGPQFDGDGIDVETLTKAEIQTRLELWDKVQKIRKEPGMESVYLMQSATGVGVRETRHIRGQYVVTLQDSLKGTRFDDVIAISSNPMVYQGKRYYFKHEGFDIPYRALVPQTLDGLILTGRCISVEHHPFWSARAMACAMAVGHAAGCAAALAVKGNVELRKLNVKKVQQLLISQNAELRI